MPFKHASAPQVVSSVKAEYPPVGNYLFNAYLSLIEKTKALGLAPPVRKKNSGLGRLEKKRARPFRDRKLGG
eukprot:COSAG04_NODE_3419_length_2828_cov_68.000733_2_plen_72_part_00